MENPEKIEIEGLKTIHKLCKFGADHNMEGCTFTEIVERMFSKIEQMKTQVNTLDEMLLNQGEVLTQAKAQADQKVKLLLCDEHLKKCESPTGIFNSQYPDEEPCLICLAKEAKAQAMPEWISVQDRMPEQGQKVLVFRPDAHNHPHKDPNFKICTYAGADIFINSHFEHVITHWKPLESPIEAQEPAND